jgi:benzoyl-CoA reductase/2-hydroxyglutaryl-CoA dehydratase subunit BcrC/BadD/HgdB
MTQVAHTLAQLQSLEAAHPETLTLLDLVAAVADAARSEEEVVAAVQHLIESGRVTLVGNFRCGDVGRSR